MALEENGRPPRVQADGQKNSQRFLPPLPQSIRVLLDGYGMEVHQRIYKIRTRFSFVLLTDPALQCAQIVSQVGNSCWLDA